jgi:hypothetical protein
MSFIFTIAKSIYDAAQPAPPPSAPLISMNVSYNAPISAEFEAEDLGGDGGSVVVAESEAALTQNVIPVVNTGNGTVDLSGFTAEGSSVVASPDSVFDNTVVQAGIFVAFLLFVLCLLCVCCMCCFRPIIRALKWCTSQGRAICDEESQEQITPIGHGAGENSAAALTARLEARLARAEALAEARLARAEALDKQLAASVACEEDLASARVAPADSAHIDLDDITPVATRPMRRPMRRSV